MAYDDSSTDNPNSKKRGPIFSAPPKATRGVKLASWIFFAPIILVFVALIVSLFVSDTDLEAAENFYKQGMRELEGHDYSWAASAFTLAIENNQDYAEAYNMRGQVYMALGEDNLALADFTRAIELDPVLHEAYVNRALFHFYYGDYELAVTDYSEAIRLRPRDSESYAARGQIYDKLGQFGPALADYQAYIRLVGNKAKGEIIQRANELEKQLTASSA